MQTTIRADQVLADSRKARPKHPFRAGTKKARLYELLKPAKGITTVQLATLLGWLPHTTRAALTGLRNDGVAVETLPAKEGERNARYRLALGR